MRLVNEAADDVNVVVHVVEQHVAPSAVAPKGENAVAAGEIEHDALAQLIVNGDNLAEFLQVILADWLNVAINSDPVMLAR